MLEALRQDARNAARALTRSPLFTLVAVASIAVGVGATSAIVTLADTLLFKPPEGIGNPDRVVTIGRTNNGRGFDNMTYPNFADLRAGTKTLTGMAAIRFDPMPLSLAGPSGGEALSMSMVSGNFFEVLQARPHIGRFFTMEDDRAPGSSNVVVLNHTYWTKRFGSDSSLVGRTIVLNGAPFTVVAVAAPRFHGPFLTSPDLWMPVMSATLTGWDKAIFTNRIASWHMAIGRLADNASLDAANAELQGIASQLEKAYPQANRNQNVVVLASMFPGDMRNMIATFMALLFAVAGVVLVIASTNVAGMLLARAAMRQREIAVRLAIGASRWQLIRQMLVETVALFVLAGGLGLAVAKAMVIGLASQIPRLPIQLAIEPQIDWRVAAFAFGAALLTGLATGLAPALQGTGLSLVPALKSDAGTTRRQRLRSGLLVTQIAFSMLLLIVAGLFARTLSHARSIDPGFDVTDVRMAQMDFGLARYDATRGIQLSDELVTRARALPRVEHAALSRIIPLQGGGMGLGGISVDGRRAPNPERGWQMDWDVVSPGYFETMGITLVRGRDFTASDRDGAPRVAILNETFAENLFPGMDPVGRTVNNGDRVLTIIGVAKAGKYRSLGEQPRNFIYVSQAQFYQGRMHLLVKTAPGAGAAVQPAIRRLVANVDPALPVLGLQSLEEAVAIGLFPQRVALYVAGSLGVVALFLALLGIYGVTAFSVAQRTREIGVRVALGADRGRVLGMVLRQGLVLAGIGVAIGAVGAFAVTRAISFLLYGLPAVDAIAFGGAAGLLTVAALAASWIPARRAAAVDPVIALRAD